MQIPNLHNIIFLILFITCMGMIFDSFLRKETSNLWKNNFLLYFNKLNTPGYNTMLQDTNNLLCDLFDYIYGRQVFTWQRIKMSALSTTIALIGLTFIIGIEKSYWYHRFIHLHNSLSLGIMNFDFLMSNIKLILLIIFIPIMLNFIPDFFSLIETRFLLEKSQKYKCSGVFFILFLDIILTSLIFLSGFLFIIATEAFFFSGNFRLSIFLSDLHLILSPADGLIFFLTTFVTSFFWLIALCFYLIWPIYKIFPKANIFFLQLVQSKNPGLSFTAYMNIIIIIVYLVYMLFYNLNIYNIIL